MLAYSRILCENREYGPEIRNYFGAKIEIIFEMTKENPKNYADAAAVPHSHRYKMTAPLQFF